MNQYHPLFKKDPGIVSAMIDAAIRTHELWVHFSELMPVAFEDETNQAYALSSSWNAAVNRVLDG
jgi:hypothetical protein